VRYTEFLCLKVTSLFQQIAAQSLPRKKKTNFKRKNRWFDSECRESKRQLRKATIRYARDPTNQEKRAKTLPTSTTFKSLLRIFSLYAKKSLDPGRIKDMEKWTEDQQLIIIPTDILDKPITHEELDAATKTLNTGKSTSADLIRC